MSPFKNFAVAAIALVSLPLSACAEDAPPLSPESKQQMEQVIREYLVNNPEVIMEAIDNLQKRNEEAKQAKVGDVLNAIEADLTSNPNDPVIGNPDGDVTVVEFFDYRCGFCKRVHPDVQTLLKEDGNIRYVLKEFPILGPASTFASQAAVGVWLHQKDKYEAFHDAMMASRGDLSNDKVIEIATQSGVDVAKLPDQMKDAKVQDTLEATARQAQLLGINGTPGFVFGNNIQPGAIPLDAMRELVAAMRAHP